MSNTSDTILYIRKHLKKKLDDARYEHTLGVAYTAVCLAMRYGEDMYKAEVAGLLHDCAKYLPDSIKLEKCKKYNISISSAEKANPSLLHAKLGAHLAMNKYNIKDTEVVNAILNHTTGKPAMTVLEKIIFVADYIEPRRDKAPHLKEIRQTAFTNLDLSVWMILEDTLAYLKVRGGAIDDMTQKACKYYRELVKGNVNESGKDSADL